MNQVGTVQAVVDAATGEVLQRLEHDEFGRLLFDSNPGLQPFGFAGGLVDADTGLVRFGARDYEPVTGRWTARDPVRRSNDGPNGYMYVRSDPLRASDPLGLELPEPGEEGCWFRCMGRSSEEARKDYEDIQGFFCDEAEGIGEVLMCGAQTVAQG